MSEAVAPRYAGTRLPRVEDTRLLTGHGTFVDDVARPGMLHACFVRSPFARARINGIDTTRCAGPARRARGLRGRRPEPGRQGGLARGRGQGHRRHAAPSAGRGRGEVRRRPRGARHRRNRYLAEDAVELVDVDYEPMPAVADFTQAVRLAAESVSSCTTRIPTTSRAAWVVRRPTRKRSRRPHTSRPRTSTSRSTRRSRSRRAASSSNGRHPRAN